MVERISAIAIALKTTTNATRDPAVSTFNRRAIALNSFRARLTAGPEQMAAAARERAIVFA